MLRAVATLPMPNTTTPISVMPSSVHCNLRYGATASSIERISTAATSCEASLFSATRRALRASSARCTVCITPLACSSVASGASSARCSPTGSTDHGWPGRRVTSAALSDDSSSMSCSRSPLSGKPIETWPIRSGAFTETVTIWNGRPLSTRTMASRAASSGATRFACTSGSTGAASARVEATRLCFASVNIATLAPMRAAWLSSASTSVARSPPAMAERKP